MANALRGMAINPLPWAIGAGMVSSATGLHTVGPADTIVHSDRGSQYASEHYQRRLADERIRCSMSRRGDCWDNAPMESFWHSLKVEETHGQDFATRAEAKHCVFGYIEGWYNPRRRHSALGYLSPANFEAKHQAEAASQGPSVEHGLTTVGVCVAGATPPVDNPAPVLLTQT